MNAAAKQVYKVFNRLFNYALIIDYLTVSVKNKIEKNITLLYKNFILRKRR